MRRVTVFLALAGVVCLLTQLAFPTVAAAKRPGPTPTPTPSATPTPTPTPSPSPQPDIATTFQINAAHTGAQTGDALKPALARRWELDFGGALSAPLIADGDVFEVASGADASGDVGLFALDQRTGRSVWGPVVLTLSPSAPKFALIAYDGGRVFVLEGDNSLHAYDSHTGAPDWTTALPGQSTGKTPPTAVNGTIYSVGQGVGATVYAVSEASGSVRWSTTINLAGQGAPVVTGTDVYVSDDCNAYDLGTATGAQKWHHAAGCSAGSGVTSVLAGGLLYVRSATGGADILLDAGTGVQVGTFSAGPAPAFDSNLGFFVVGGHLEAHDLATGAVTWTFAESGPLSVAPADDTLTSAPVVANGCVYVASTQGYVFAIAEATGRPAWSDRVGLPFQNPELASLAIGQGGLAAPFGKTLVFYTIAPATTPSPQPTSSGPDQARSYQLNPQHTGGQDPDPLGFPLAKRWTAATSGLPSYPLIAGGHVFFTDGASLVALNEADGSAAWGPVTLPQASLLAYDSGAVFALGSGGAVEAFDGAGGAQLWSAQLPGSGFRSYPTAADGAVYVAGGGALLAVSEQSGAVLWSQSVLGSGDSSPVVTSSGVYLAYPCPEVYDFDPTSGALIWHVGPSSCTATASGPRTAVLSNGRLYVRDLSTGLVLDAATGAQLGVFRSTGLPAFSGSMAFFTEESSVEGWDLTTGSLVWRWDADPIEENTPTCPSCPQRGYRVPSGPPVVVNGFVLFALGQNAYALDGRTGRQVWTGVLGVSTDIGTISAGEGLLALAGGPTPAFPSALGAVTVYAAGGTVNPPSTTAADEAVTHQIDVAHTGSQGTDSLTPPLAQEWSMDLGGPVTYPLIVGGRAFFAVAAASGGSVLHAIDLTTGANVWGPVSLTGPATGCPAILAADSGRVFVQESGILHAFDAVSGTELWSRIVGGSMECPAPVASGGQMFDGALRLDEETGAEVWERAVQFARFDAVTATDVYVDAGCEIDETPADGTAAWLEGGTCGSAGPILAPALYGGRLYTQDFELSDNSPRPILDASTGAPVTTSTGTPLTYASHVSPAFAGSLAYFMVGGVLEAHNLPDLGLAWTFAGDGNLVTAPVVANGVVYIGSSSGNLYGVDAATGSQVWTANVGAAMSSPDPVFAPELTGLTVGEGWLLVPAGTRLAAYSTATSATSSHASRELARR